MLASPRTRRSLGRFAVATAVSLSTLGVAACGDDNGTGPGGISGTYTLQTVNGQGLPFTMFDGEVDDGQGGTFDVLLRILSGSVTLNSNNTYRARLDFDFRIDGQPCAGCVEDDDEEGTFSVSGSTITFDPEDDDPQTATVSGNTITVSFQEDVDEDGEDETYTLVFRK
jgi:hypothetical protein